MLDYVFILIPTAFTVFLLGVSATIDPIESAVVRVGTADAYSSAGFTHDNMEVMLNAEIEKITFATGSSIQDKRVRVKSVTSGVEEFADAVFSLGKVVDSAQRALGLLSYVIEVDFVHGDDKPLSAYVQFRDAFTGNFVSDATLSVEPEKTGVLDHLTSDPPITEASVRSLVTKVATEIVATSEPYLYAASVYKQALDDPSLYPLLLEYIDAELPQAPDRTIPWFYNLRGLVAEAANVDGYAVRSYRLALDADPQFDPAELNLGLLWLNYGDFELARRYLERSEQFPRLEGIRHVYLADLAYRQGDIEKALAELRKAEQIEPRLAAAYEMRARILKASGNELGAERAMVLASRARRMVPNQGLFNPY